MLTITIGRVANVVKFKVVHIMGDNLGSNGIFGFNDSFKCHVYCRMCSANTEDCRVMLREHVSQLRTEGIYKTHVVQKNPQLTDIKEDCAFDFITDFHITKSRSIDLMHDVLEDVYVNFFRAILYNFIYAKKYFILAALNHRIEIFNYSYDTNAPPENDSQSKKSKSNMKFSAIEMLGLVRYLGVMIGDFVPKNDRYWKLYSLLRQLLNILMSPRMVPQYFIELSELVMKLNGFYIELVGPFKPKFHFLVHYPSILEYFGACVQFWCMKYESCHRDIKACAVLMASKVNLLKTIEIKQILKMC